MARIPSTLLDEYDVEVLVIDDSSHDATFERSETLRRAETLPFPLHVLFNPENQGYGGNQKIGFHFAIREGFDYVALLHGDGQYAPECLPELVRPLRDGAADAVFGSRMLDEGGARAAGCRSTSSSGTRSSAGSRTRCSRRTSASSTRATACTRRRRFGDIPFELNTNDFHFDTEIIIQLVYAGERIREIPIPTYYGDEICHVNGLKYAGDVARATLKARMQDLGLLYERKFDVRAAEPRQRPVSSEARLREPAHVGARTCRPGSRVLDLGCAGGWVGAELRRAGATSSESTSSRSRTGSSSTASSSRPERRTACDRLRRVRLRLAARRDRASSESGAVPRRAVRGALAEPWRQGHHQHGQHRIRDDAVAAPGRPVQLRKRGILDLTHTRLFTFSTLRRLLEGAGFQVLELRGVPAPFPLALGRLRGREGIDLAQPKGQSPLEALLCVPDLRDCRTASVARPAAARCVFTLGDASQSDRRGVRLGTTQPRSGHESERREIEHPGEDEEVAESRPGTAEAPTIDHLRPCRVSSDGDGAAQEVDDLAGRRARPEDRGHAARLQLVGVVLRDRPADDDEDVVGAVRA